MLATELITENWKKNKAMLTIQSDKGQDGGTGKTLGGPQYLILTWDKTSGRVL